MVAVIDDEIEVADKPHSFTEPFGALRKRFDESSIICHLHHYQQTLLPPDDEVNLPLVERAFEIAAAADLVVIDWHLGMKDDPSHALSVIRKLTERAGIRFVLVNTRIEPREPARVIQEQFGATLEPAPEGAAADTLIRLRIGDNFFVSVRQKTFTAEDAAELLDEAQDWLATSFPDHLHWAGLEIAVRVREMLPKVVAAMPKGTNAALVHQLLFQRNAEIAEQITEVFLDELKLHFKTAPLATVSDETLFESLKTAMQKLAANTADLEAVHDEFSPGWAATATAAEEKKKAMKRLKAARPAKATPAAPAATAAPAPAPLSVAPAATVPAAAPTAETPAAATPAPAAGAAAISEEEARYLEEAEKQKLTPLEDATLAFRERLAKMPQIWGSPKIEPVRAERTRKKHFPSLGEPPEAASTAAYLRKAFSTTDAAFAAWASLKESAQLAFSGTEILFPGCVLRKIEPTETDPTWLLCITPACDCYWGKAKGYLFVIGTELKAKAKSKLSQTQTWFKTYQIAWDAKALIVKAPATSGATLIDGYKVDGAVRSAFASRIIQRVWSYQSRVGVDTSEYYRQIRDEV